MCLCAIVLLKKVGLLYYRVGTGTIGAALKFLFGAATLVTENC
jgi:hypothetical protein